MTSPASRPPANRCVTTVEIVTLPAAPVEQRARPPRYVPPRNMPGALVRDQPNSVGAGRPIVRRLAIEPLQGGAGLLPKVMPATTTVTARSTFTPLPETAPAPNPSPAPRTAQAAAASPTPVPIQTPLPGPHPGSTRTPVATPPPAANRTPSTPPPPGPTRNPAMTPTPVPTRTPSTILSPFSSPTPSTASTPTPGASPWSTPTPTPVPTPPAFRRDSTPILPEACIKLAAEFGAAWTPALPPAAASGRGPASARGQVAASGNGVMAGGETGSAREMLRASVALQACRSWANCRRDFQVTADIIKPARPGLAGASRFTNFLSAGPRVSTYLGNNSAVRALAVVRAARVNERDFTVVHFINVEQRGGRQRLDWADLTGGIGGSGVAGGGDIALEGGDLVIRFEAHASSPVEPAVSGAVQQSGFSYIYGKLNNSF